jgi:formylglycine-generating enzyme required for sulfatase activity
MARGGLGGVALALALALAGPTGCRSAAPAPAAGNVVLVVDTDAPVPKLVSQLRVDLFDASGTWYASRDVTAASPSAWPVSFGVDLPDGVASGEVVVRLRAYPVGQVRDYRGYRYQERPAGDSTTTLVADPAPTDGPRLVAGDTDVTPPTEPLPALAIDRLLLVPLTAGVVGAVRTTLAGACFGTMADMRDPTALATCVDTEAQRADVTAEAVDPSLDVPPSVQGTFEAAYAQPCAGAPRPATTAADGTPLHDDDVCVTGGAFVLGSNDDAIHDTSDDVPAQVALVPSFYVDRYEVTVGRYRAAVAAGRLPLGALVNDGPIQGNQDATTVCTYSGAPMGREEMPVNCVPEQSARAFCQVEGGDLPLEAQWEYAAMISGGRTVKTSYPWGDGSDTLPACTDVVYSRGNGPLSTFCNNVGFGPASVTDSDHVGGDRSLGLAIVDLSGNVVELTLDTFASHQAECWVGAPLELPSCRAGAGPVFTTRGGSWDLAPDQIIAAERDSLGTVNAGVGFRCVRKGTSP